MKNKKGFTLVELLAVILILGMLGALVSIPIIQSIKKSKNDLQQYQIIAIENAARDWGVENILELPTLNNQNTKCITVRQLVDNGFLDEVPTNLKTGQPIDENSGVSISCNGTSCKRLNYDYVTSCDGTIVDSGEEVLPEPEIPETNVPVDDYQCFSYAVKEENGSTLSEIKIVEYLYDGGTCGADVEIPERINNIVVTEIGDSAFVTHGSVITSVSIPYGVTTIGRSAFQSQKLTSVNIPSTASEITVGDYAFASNNISELTISNSSYGNSVKISIGDYSFYDNELANISFNNAVTDIGNFAFLHNNLVSVTNVTSGYYTKIGNSSFAHNNLESFTWPASISEIGMFAFLDNQLTDSRLSFSNYEVANIGPGAFNNNQFETKAFWYSNNELVSYGGAERNVEAINFPLNEIGTLAFAYNNLTGVLTLSDSSGTGKVGTSIGEAAFTGNNLNSVTIENANLLIGNRAFGNSFADTSKYYFYVNESELVVAEKFVNNNKNNDIVSGSELKAERIYSKNPCNGLETYPDENGNMICHDSDGEWWYDENYYEIGSYICPSNWSACPKP